MCVGFTELSPVTERNHLTGAAPAGGAFSLRDVFDVVRPQHPLALPLAQHIPRGRAPLQRGHRFGC